MAITKTGRLLPNLNIFKNLRRGGIGATLANPNRGTSIRKELKRDLTSPLMMGFGAMGVAAGDNSVGGEVAGVAAGSTAATLANKGWVKYISKMPRIGPSKILRFIPAAIAGITGYELGNEFGNKVAPGYRRKPPINVA